LIFFPFPSLLPLAPIPHFGPRHTSYVLHLDLLLFALQSLLAPSPPIADQRTHAHTHIRTHTPHTLSSSRRPLTSTYSPSRYSLPFPALDHCGSWLSFSLPPPLVFDSSRSLVVLIPAYRLTSPHIPTLQGTTSASFPNYRRSFSHNAVTQTDRRSPFPDPSSIKPTIAFLVVIPRQTLEQRNVPDARLRSLYLRLASRSAA
jgi:hypothetical protein